MSGLSTKLSRFAQAGFILSLLIVTIGTIKLFALSNELSSQAIDNLKPYAYAFEFTVGASVVLAIVATVLNFRTRSK